MIILYLFGLYYAVICLFCGVGCAAREPFKLKLILCGALVFTIGVLLGQFCLRQIFGG